MMETVVKSAHYSEPGDGASLVMNELTNITPELRTEPLWCRLRRLMLVSACTSDCYDGHEGGTTGATSRPLGDERFFCIAPSGCAFFLTDVLRRLAGFSQLAAKRMVEVAATEAYGANRAPSSGRPLTAVFKYGGVGFGLQ